HKVILVPHTRPLAAEEARELREYVAAGGQLLLEFPAGPLSAHEPWLEELVGARQLRDEQAYAFYMLPEEGDLADDLPAGEPVQLYAKEALVLALTSGRTAGEVLPQFRDKVRTSDIQTVANVSARPDQSERWPGIVLNEVGAGQVLTTAIPLTVSNQDAARCPWPRMLAQNLVRSLLGQQLVSVGAYSRVEVNLCRQLERLMLHFVNHGYGAGEFIHGHGEQEFLRELPVRLSPQLRESLREARLEPEGEALALTEEGFMLPVLGVHQAVSLK
ncbi:MAG: hypothetical protein ACM3VW_00145, partial [Bacteroidota bacterium]